MSPLAGLEQMNTVQNQGLAPLATSLGPSGANANKLKQNRSRLHNPEQGRGEQ
jgi:hypothetical protein